MMWCRLYSTKLSKDNRVLYWYALLIIDDEIRVGSTEPSQPDESQPESYAALIKALDRTLISS